MAKMKNKWLYRALCAALAVTLMSGVAVMTPIADIVGTNITAHASENIIAQGRYWKLTDDDEDDNYKLTFFDTIPNSSEIHAEAYEIYAEAEAEAGASAPSLAELIQASWFFATEYVTEVTIEEDTKTSADASYLFSDFLDVTSMDLSNLDTSNATDMEAMFSYCSSLTSLNLSGWDTSKVENMSGMFYGCNNLETIIVGNGWNTDKVISDGYMFDSCASLVGGKGTKFADAQVTDKTYARIDGGPASATPGYFTKGQAPLTYTVTWENIDGTVLEKDENVEENTTPSYDGTTPSKTGENGIKYVFTGWNDGTKTYAPDALPTVTGNVTYTAVYTEYQNHDDILFAPWTSTNSLPTAAGNYYLTGNVTISGTWNAPDEINLCLNGYGIRYSGDNGSVIYLGIGYTLNIFDCDTTKEHYITLSNFRGTDVSDTGTETTVTDGTGVIKVNGGYITGGNNSDGGGGINAAYQSANVYIKGVTFIGNKANGAGNCGQGSAMLLIGGNLSLYGTKFFYNYAQRDGGANAETVCRWSGTTSLKDVDMQYNVGGGINITGGNNAIVSGKTIIRNNVYSTTNTKEFNASVTTLDGSGLTDGSYIGIRNGDANSAPFTTNVATDYVQYFHMDPRFTKLIVSTNSDGYGIRKATYTVTWKNGEDIIETDEKVIEGDTPTYDSEMPTKASDGNYVYKFKGWTDGTNTYTAENLPAVGGNVTYTAVYDALPIIYSDDVFVNSTESTPEVVVTDPFTKEILTAGTDYTLEISEDTVKITGIGSYAGEVQKSYTTLSREVKASITNRRKIGNNAKVVLSSEWYLPKNATNIKAGIARLSTDDTNITKYDVYNNGVKKASALKTTSGKYSFSLLMNSTHANQNLYAVTYVTYEIDRVPYVSISKMSESLA